MLNFIKRGVMKLNNYLNKPEVKTPNNLTYLEYLVQVYKSSDHYKKALDGVRYYKGEHDVLKRVKKVIGSNGNLEELNNMPCNKKIDNQYAIAVDKKINYLLGRPPTYKFGDDVPEELNDQLQNICNDAFTRVLKSILKDSLNCGVGYMYVYVDDNSELKVKKLNSIECYPVYKDDERRSLDFLIRVYKKCEFIAGAEKEIEYCEVYTQDKLVRYQLNQNKLIKLGEVSYITDHDNKEYSWGVIPVIPFKYNDNEITLLERVKNLQDSLNEILSQFTDVMVENPRNSIMVIHNYDGQDLGEFRHNLNVYGAVKVRTGGGVETLQVEVNSNNYTTIMESLKNAIIENAKSYDAKDDRLGGNPNQMNIQSMYSDIDIDSNGIESEYLASFEILSELIKKYLTAMKFKINEGYKLDIIFNKDVLINESQVVSDIRGSVGILSKESLIENHPYIDDVPKELKRIKAEKDAIMQDEIDYMHTEKKPNKGDMNE